MELTGRIIGAAFEVSNTLGAGFLEKVYERALLLELKRRGLHAVTQRPFKVTYKGDYVGEYFADMVIENQIAVELKCVEKLHRHHRAQCLNYLRASQLQCVYSSTSKIPPLNTGG